MIFFTDENIPIRAARMLEIFESKHKVDPLIDRFERGTPDLAWIPVLAKDEETTAIVCGDGRILKNKAERAVLRQSNLTFVHLAAGWANTPWNTYAWKIIKVWPDIVRTVERAKLPTLFEVRIGSLKVETRCLIAEL